MTTYRWTDAGFVDKSTGLPMHITNPDAICMPHVIPDVPEYRSPINGAPITSRSHQREDLKRNDCVMAEPRKKRGFINRDFTKKRGLKHIED